MFLGRINKYISLVERSDGPDVSFVYWTDISSNKGRRQSYFPGSNKVKAIVASMVPEERWAGNVVIERCPCVMVMHKRMLADEIPGWCLLLKRHAEAQFFSGPILTIDGPSHGAPGEVSCILCKAAESTGVMKITDADASGYYQCSVCLCVWHRACALLVGRGQWYRDGDVYGLFPEKQPNARGFVCAVCIGS